MLLTDSLAKAELRLKEVLVDNAKLIDINKFKLEWVRTAEIRERQI